MATLKHIRVVVQSQVNSIVQPMIDESLLSNMMFEAQALADSTGRPVRLMRERYQVVTVNPETNASVR